MGNVFWIAIIVAWIVIISQVKKDKQKNQSRTQGRPAAGQYRPQAAPPQPQAAMGRYQQQSQPQAAMGGYRQQSQPQAAMGGYRQQSQPQPAMGGYRQRVMTEEDRARLEKYRQQKNAKQNGRQPDIVERAKNNVSQYSGDTTLAQMEAQHQHSERVAPATVTQNGIVPEPAHPHNADHVSEFILQQDEELLGSVEDLIVMGYSGKLSYERDFLGEAMDMIGRFTVPDKLPGGGEA